MSGPFPAHPETPFEEVRPHRAQNTHSKHTLHAPPQLIDAQKEAQGGDLDDVPDNLRAKDFWNALCDEGALAGAGAAGRDGTRGAAGGEQEGEGRIPDLDMTALLEHMERGWYMMR